MTKIAYVVMAGKIKSPGRPIAVFSDREKAKDYAETKGGHVWSVESFNEQDQCDCEPEHKHWCPVAGGPGRRRVLQTELRTVRRREPDKYDIQAHSLATIMRLEDNAKELKHNLQELVHLIEQEKESSRELCPDCWKPKGSPECQRSHPLKATDY